MNATSSFGRAIAKTSVANIAVPISALLSAPLLAQSLGVEGRGELAAATAPTILAVTVATVGIPEAVTFYSSRRPQVRGSALRRGVALLAVSGTICTSLVIILSDYLSGARASVSSVIIVAALSVAPALMLVGVRSSAMSAGAWRRVNNEKLILAGARIILLTLLLATETLTVLSAAVTLAFTPVLAGLAYVGYRSNTCEACERETALVQKLISFGVRAWIGAVAGILLSRLDQVLITPLVGTAELGIYAVAVNIGDVPLIITLAVGAVLLSADAAKNDNVRLGAASRLTLAANFVCAGLIAVSMPLWVPVVFGAEFAGVYLSAGVLLATAVLGAPGSICGIALIARGKPEARSMALLAALLANVAMLFALVPSMGAIGAAYAMFAGSMIASVINIAVVNRSYGVRLSEMMLLRRSDLLLVKAVLFDRRSALTLRRSGDDEDRDDIARPREGEH
jgi:O-antigen/teichoic acid export membrane protein